MKTRSEMLKEAVRELATAEEEIASRVTAESLSRCGSHLEAAMNLVQQALDAGPQAVEPGGEIREDAAELRSRVVRLVLLLQLPAEMYGDWSRLAGLSGDSVYTGDNPSLLFEPGFAALV